MADDETLVYRIKGGDLSAFDELMNKYRKQVYHLALKMTGNHEDAEDISQEAFVRVFNALPAWKPKASFYTWLRTITLNLCVDYHRTRTRRQMQTFVEDKDGFLMNVSADPSYSPLEIIEADELKKKVMLAVEKLSSQQRKAFMLCHYGGLPQKEAAEIMGCAVGTIKTHLSRATARMRDFLKDFLDDQELEKDKPIRRRKYEGM